MDASLRAGLPSRGVPSILASDRIPALDLGKLHGDKRRKGFVDRADSPDLEDIKAELEVVSARVSERNLWDEHKHASVFGARTPGHSDDDYSSSGTESSSCPEDASASPWDRPKLQSHLDIGKEELAVIRKMYKQALKTMDESARTHDDPGVDQETFVQVFRQALDYSEEDLRHIFQKVDANGDGRCQWSELVGYIYIESQRVAETRRGRGRFLLSTTQVRVAEKHRNMIDKILTIDRGDRQQYITLGRDDVVAVWDGKDMRPLQQLLPPRSTFIVVPPAELNPAFFQRDVPVDSDADCGDPDCRDGAGSQGARKGSVIPKTQHTRAAVYSRITPRLPKGFRNLSLLNPQQLKPPSRPGTAAARADAELQAMKRASKRAHMRSASIPQPRPPAVPFSSTSRAPYRRSTGASFKYASSGNESENLRNASHKFSPSSQRAFIMETFAGRSSLTGDDDDRSVSGSYRSRFLYVPETAADSTVGILPPGAISVTVDNQQNRQKAALDPKHVSRYSGRASCWATDAAFDASNGRLFLSSLDGYVYMHSSRQGGFEDKGKSLIRVDNAPLCLYSFPNFITNSQILAVGDSAGNLCLYDSNTYQLKMQRQYHRTHVSKAAVTFGVRMATASFDGRLCMTDIQSWNVIWSVRAHSKGVVSFATSEYLKLLATAGSDRVVTVWDPFLQQAVATLPSYRSPIVDVIIDDLHNLLAIAYSDKTVKLYDIRRMQCIQTVQDRLEHFPEDKLTAMAYDSANYRLLTAGSVLRGWSLEDVDGASQVPGMVPSESKRHLVPWRTQYSLERQIKSTGTSRNTIEQAHRSRIVFMAHSEMYAQLVTVDVGGTVRLWNLNTGAPTLQYEVPHRTLLSACCLDHLQRRLLTASEDGSVRVWNVNNGELMHTYESRETCVSRILWLPLGCPLQLVLPGWDGRLVFGSDFSIDSNAPSVKIHAHDGDITCAHQHGSLIATGGNDGSLAVFKCSNKAPVVIYRDVVPKGASGTPAIEQVHFARQGSVLVVATEEGDLHIFAAASQRLMCQFAGRVAQLPVLDTDETGTILAAGDATGKVTVFSISGPDSAVILRPLHVWTAHDTQISKVCVCRDRPLLLSAAITGDIVAWTLDGLYFARLGQSAPWPPMQSRPSTSQMRRQRHSSRRPALMADSFGRNHIQTAHASALFKSRRSLAPVTDPTEPDAKSPEPETPDAGQGRSRSRSRGRFDALQSDDEEDEEVGQQRKALRFAAIRKASSRLVSETYHQTIQLFEAEGGEVSDEDPSVTRDRVDALLSQISPTATPSVTFNSKSFCRPSTLASVSFASFVRPSIRSRARSILGSSTVR